MCGVGLYSVGWFVSVCGFWFVWRLMAFVFVSSIPRTHQTAIYIVYGRSVVSVGTTIIGVLSQSSDYSTAQHVDISTLQR